MTREKNRPRAPPRGAESVVFLSPTVRAKQESESMHDDNTPELGHMIALAIVILLVVLWAVCTEVTSPF